jgi:UDP-N-acetylglucosamine 2-epimerase (non-hydrolysing)
VLITAHRRESFGAGFVAICEAIGELAVRFHDRRFVYPVHPNPEVRDAVFATLGSKRLANVHLIEPLDYLSFVLLMSRAELVLTDSGGIQEEAPSLGTPVLVLRERTERMEGVRAGVARLVGTDTGRIVSEVERLLDSPQACAAMAHAVQLYGDGRAADRAVAAIAAHLGLPAAPGDGVALPGPMVGASLR